VQLVNAGTAAPSTGPLTAPVVELNDTNPDRAVSQSTSRTKLVPNSNGTFGLMSETRETIAPVTLLGNNSGVGPARTITIEFLGEWVLRAIASGYSSESKVFYGPGTVNPQSPVLSIIDSTNAITRVLNLQDLLGNNGLDIPVPGLVDITIGEHARKL